MKDIEKILSKVDLENKKIPQRVHNKIEYALNNLDINEECKGITGIIQKIKDNYLRKLATAVASITIVFLGSITVYAAFGGTIDGKPVFEWVSHGIEFSDEYSEYKEIENGQKLQHGETTVELVATIYDENYVLLEFDVHVSQEDKEYLRLGEYMIEDEFIELANSQIHKEWLLEEKEKGIKNTIDIKLDTNVPNRYNNVGDANICINGKGYWTGRVQTRKKISDYEYKFYQMYFLTDEMTEGKEEISLSFNNNVMGNIGEVGNEGALLSNAPGNQKEFELEGNIDIKVSKNRLDENTKVIIPECEEIKYKNMTQKVDEIRITPLHIIAKVSIQIENINKDNIWNIISKEAKVYNENGIELTSYTSKLNENFVYKGKEISEGDVYDIKSNTKEKATMNISEIIIIEKTENMNGLKIIPTLSEQIWIEGSGNENKHVELEALNIDLTKK